MIYLIGVVVVSMSVSALCSLMEACLLSMSHGDIADISSKNPKFSAIWNIFKGNIQKPIAVILIINTIAHTTGASLSGAKFDELFGGEWIVLFSFLFSFAMIQWTEILPKTIGVTYNKRIAHVVTMPLFFLIRIFTPLIMLIQLLNKPFVRKSGSSSIRDAIREISVLSKFAFINNLISKDQEQIISRTIGLTRKKVRDIMIPRNEIKFLNDRMSMMEALVEAHIHNHTRYPLIGDSGPDEIIGYINFKDIVSSLQINPGNPSLVGIARPMISISEDDNFSSLFKKMTNSHQHIAVVKNSENGVSGLVTLEDVIEEIVGEIEDEYDELPSYFYPIAVDRYIAGGGVGVRQINAAMGIDLPDPDKSLNEWIQSVYGAGQKSGNRYENEMTVMTIKKIRRSKIKEAIIVKKRPRNDGA